MLKDDLITEASPPCEEYLNETVSGPDADNSHDFEDVSQLIPDPVFRRCVIVGPDGKPRKSWEMWIGDFCFGKADSKESLLACLKRMQSPSNTFHWRSSRAHFQAKSSGRRAKTAA